MRNRTPIVAALRGLGIVTLAAALTAGLASPARATAPAPENAPPTTMVVAGHSYSSSIIGKAAPYLTKVGPRYALESDALADMARPDYATAAAFLTDLNAEIDRANAAAVAAAKTPAERQALLLSPCTDKIRAYIKARGVVGVKLPNCLVYSIGAIWGAAAAILAAITATGIGAPAAAVAAAALGASAASIVAYGAFCEIVGPGNGVLAGVNFITRDVDLGCW